MDIPRAKGSNAPLAIKSLLIKVSDSGGRSAVSGDHVVCLWYIEYTGATRYGGVLTFSVGIIQRLAHFSAWFRRIYISHLT